MTRRLLSGMTTILFVFGVGLTPAAAQFTGGAPQPRPAAKAAAKEVDRTKIEILDEPRTIDPATLVPEILAKPATVTFKEASLKDVAAWLQTELKTGVLLDRPALNDEGRLVSDPVTDELNNEPVYLLLDRLRSLQLGWYLEAGLIHITTQAKADEIMATVSYNLGDLFDVGYEPTSILTAIQEGTSGQWDLVDGVGGDLVLLGDVLFARQTHHVHREVSGLLAALRKHGRRTFTNDPPQHEPLRAKLDQPITVDFQETPFSTVISELERLSGAKFRIDDSGLKEEGIRRRTPITLRLTEQKLRTVLQVLLSQHLLSAVLEHGALTVTSQAHADEIMKTAVFDVRDLCQDESESTSLQQAIESQTSAVWEMREGTGGTLIFARPGVMVVRQSERTLDDVLRLLENYRLALKLSKPRPLRSIDPQEILVRYYRLPTAMATELERILPELVKPETWKSAEHPEAPGRLRKVTSRPGPSVKAAAGSSSATPNGPLLEHSVLIIEQSRAVHKEIGELLLKLEDGDAFFENPPMGTGGQGGFGGGGFGGQGGFGGGFPSVSPKADKR